MRTSGAGMPRAGSGGGSLARIAASTATSVRPANARCPLSIS